MTPLDKEHDPVKVPKPHVRAPWVDRSEEGFRAWIRDVNTQDGPLNEYEDEWVPEVHRRVW